MSDLENRLYSLEALCHEDRSNISHVLGELTTKVDQADYDWWKNNCMERLDYLENFLCKIMKFLEENWGITNVDDLI